MWDVVLESAALLASGWIAALFFWRPSFWRLTIPRSISLLRVAGIVSLCAAALDVVDNFRPVDAWAFSGADAALLWLEEGFGNFLGGILFAVGILSALWEAPVVGRRLLQLEERVRSREKRLREAARVAKLGFFDNDLTRGDLVWSGHLFHSLGYAPDEFHVQEQYKDDMHPDDWPLYKRAVEGCTPESPEYEAVFRMRAPGGQWRYLRVNGTCTFDEARRMTRRSGTAQDITDLVEAKRLAERRLAKLTEAQAAGRVGTYDYYPLEDRLDGGGGLAMLGYDAREAEQGMDSVYSRMHPEDRLAVEAAIARTTPENPRYQCDFRIRDAKGGWRIYSARGQCDFDEAGRCVRRFGSFQDITETAEARALAEQRLDALNRAQAVGRVGTWEVDIEAGEIRYSDAYRRMLEWETSTVRFSSLDELSRLYVDDFHDSETQVVRREAFWKRFAVLKPELPTEDVEYEAELKTGKGNVLHVLQRIQVRRNRQGKIVLLLGATVDITRQKQAERERKRTERQFQTLLEHSSQGVLIAGGERGHYMNPAARAILRWESGTPPPALSAIVDLTHPEGGWDPRAAVRNVLAGTSPSERGVSRLVIAGEPWVSLTVTPAEWDGEPACQLLLVDVTQERLAALEKAEFEGRLRQTQKLETLGTLAGGIAHDFNNILTPILGYSDLALMTGDLDPALADDLEQIRGGAQRGAHLVSQILSFSRKTEARKAPLDLHVIVGEVLKLARATLPASISVERTFRANQDTVVADATQLHQVVMNLVTNAKHAMESRPEGLLRVEIENAAPAEAGHEGTAQADPPWVRLRVTDNGCGMTAEVRDRVFEPFFTTKGPGSGTGLGLSVVHGIVTDHGGTIEVHSEPGIGTRFDVFLPCGAARAASATEPGIGTAQGGTERVLVLDDEPQVSALAMAGLTRLGYSVVAANDPGQVLAMFRERPDAFDVLVTDHTMPGMSGLALIQVLRDAHCFVPAVLMTGYSERGFQDIARAAGVQTLLAKPFDVTALAAAVREALRGVTVPTRQVSA